MITHMWFLAVPRRRPGLFRAVQVRSGRNRNVFYFRLCGPEAVRNGGGHLQSR